MAELKFTDWALAQVETRLAGDLPQAKVQALVDALAALRGKNRQVFGMGPDKIEPAGRQRLEARLIEALVGWKQHFQSGKDTVGQLELDGVAKAYDVPALRLTQRLPLKCDPLGTREGLSPEWLARLVRLDEAKAGKRKVNPDGVHWVGTNESPNVEFGAPDAQALYAHALRHEASADPPFPRELAAFWNTANGISIDDDPVLRPIDQWEADFEGRGQCIGCGGYVQGSLILEDGKKQRVLDVDDDGEERAQYASFGAFVDALLGR